MTLIVYIDVLLCTNLYINLLLLRCTEWTAHTTFSRGRRWLAAALGAVSSLLMVLPSIHWLLLLLLRLGLAFCLMQLASGSRRVHTLLRMSLLFFGANVLFAGAVLLCWTLWLPDFFWMHNGAVYCDISVWTLLLSTTGAYGVLWLLQRLRPRTSEAVSTRFRIRLDGKETICRAIPDSGNALRDVFTDRPVSVIRLGALRPVLPPTLMHDLQILQSGGMSPKGWIPSPRLRMIPGMTVGGDSLLPAVAPEQTQVWVNDRWQLCPPCWLAVCPDNRMPDTDCLLHCELLQPQSALYVSKNDCCKE